MTTNVLFLNIKKIYNLRTMNIKFSDYLKGIFATSIAALIPSKSDATILNFSDLTQDKTTSEILSEKNNQLYPKLLLSFYDDDSYSAIGHRSHRSHSSHSSHRSHYSSTTNTNNYNNTNNSNSNIALPSKNKNHNSTSTVTTFKLGDRTITEGMKGEDVTQMVNILIKKGYLELKDGQKSVTGIYEFTGVIVDALKEFQKAKGMEADGIVGPTTVYYLKEN